MNSLNSIILEGNVVRTPEIRETGKGSSVCTLGVAVNRWYKSGDGLMQKEVSFFDVDTWGTLAKMCAESCEKGRGVRVVGRLKQNRWQDTEGKNRSRIVIIAEHLELKPKFSGTDDSAARNLHESLHQADQDIAALADLAEAAEAAKIEQEAAVF